VSIAAVSKLPALNLREEERTGMLGRFKERILGRKKIELKGESRSQSDDKRCIQLILDGDRNAYQFLVEKYRTKAFSIAFSILRSEHDAEDVVQESFVKAYLSLKDFRGDSAFYTWFYRIVYNMAVDLKRKVSRTSSVSVEPYTPSGEAGDKPEAHVPEEKLQELNRIPGPQDELLRKQQAKRIKEVLGEISDEHRTVIMLREVDGMSYEEIAEVVGVSKGTVMSRLHYARKKLQQALKEFAPDDWSAQDDNGSLQNEF